MADESASWREVARGMHDPRISDRDGELVDRSGLDDAGLDRSYAAHREAYVRIFDRLGLDYDIVSALSGAMGGSGSGGWRRRSG